LFEILFYDASREPALLRVELFGTDLVKLHNAINSATSRWEAAAVQQTLITAGRGSDYREAVCPYCQATNLLISLPLTPQIYCSFCDSLFCRDPRNKTGLEEHFRLCSQCGMYSRPRTFSVFYFYYAVVTTGFHYDTTSRCSGCMRSTAWKMVLVNLLGVLAFPFALVQLYRAYATRSVAGPMDGIDTANLWWLRGNVEGALKRYDEIMERVPLNAGVKYNVARGLMLNNDLPHAQAMFEMSLDDCANYWPSVHGLFECLAQQGKHKELAAARKLWLRES
jgi:hypothetical protein